MENSFKPSGIVSIWQSSQEFYLFEPPEFIVGLFSKRGRCLIYIQKQLNCKNASVLFFIKRDWKKQCLNSKNFLLEKYLNHMFIFTEQAFSFEECLNSFSFSYHRFTAWVCACLLSLKNTSVQFYQIINLLFVFIKEIQ